MAHIDLSIPFVFVVQGVERGKRKTRQFPAKACAHVQLKVADEMLPAFEWTDRARYSDTPFQRVVFVSEGSFWEPVYRSDCAGEPNYSVSPEKFVQESESWNPHHATSLQANEQAIARCAFSEHQSTLSIDDLMPRLSHIEHDSREETEQSIRLRTGSYCVHDRNLYRRCLEPIWEISTFGLGGSRGSVAVMLQRATRTAEGNTRAYPLTQLDVAIREARELATSRNNNEPSLPDENMILHRPEAVTFRPSREDPVLTPEAWLSHPAGIVCPYCESQDVDARSLTFTLVGRTMHQRASCNGCGRHWSQRYQLSGYSITKDS